MKAIFGLLKNKILDWFGSKYYLKLYRNRNYAEARAFLDVLLGHLQPSFQNRFLDVCCGRGRHSIYLANKGFSVVGVDNAKESIEAAKKSEASNLKFYVQDIREPLAYGQFDFALNLFTSFGYFDSDAESVKSLVNISESLIPGGSFLIDFLNESNVVNNLHKSDNVSIDGIDYRIKRSADDSFIRKSIKVTDGEKTFDFSEQVRRYKLNDFKSMLSVAGFSIKNVFGSYQLSAFDAEDSDRLIIHSIKN